MADWGVKVTKSGSVSGSDVRDIILSSKYSMLKYHSTTTDSVTFNPGDTVKYIDFPHSLGYVPAFVAYLSSTQFEDGKERLVPCYSWGGTGGHSYAYANSSNIRCYYKLDTPWNTMVANLTGYQFDISGGGVSWIMGNVAGSGCGSAWNYEDVLLEKDQSIVSAQIDINNVRSGATNQNTKYKVWGVDEDNPGSPTTSSTKTTAYDAREQAKVSGTWNFGTDCKDQVEEIIARSGWSSGNNMAMILVDNASEYDANVWIADSDINSTLTVVKSGTFTVTFRVIIFKDKIAT